MKCKICRETKENGFFLMYLEAYQKSSGELGTGHNASELFWAEYLTEIQKNSLTGEWAKEVIKHSIEDGNGIVK